MKHCRGSGIVNDFINNLNTELHLPGYNFIGPGTKLQKRLSRGDKGINPLDELGKDHDIAYHKHKDLLSRHKADKILEEKAWERVKAKDSTLGEKAAAWLVTNIMKVKRKLGMGVKPPTAKKTLRKLKTLKDRKSKTLKQNTSTTTKQAAVRSQNGRKKINKTPRIITTPKTGGILPLIPLFAGLSALGTLTGGAAAIANAVNNSKGAQKKLDESKRHNATMEAIALGKKGNGLYLSPYRKGMGLSLKRK